MSVAEEVAATLGGKANGTGWMARCPCHMDNEPSLSIGETSDGKVLLKCHANCSQDDLVDWAHSREFDLSGGRPKLAGRIVAEYDYRDENNTLRYQAIRRSPKAFQQRRPDGKGGWIWNTIGVELLPYRLPEMLAEPNKPVFVTEGEKDTDRLTEAGLTATCNSGGAGKWRPELNVWFEGRNVVILADNDEAGHKHAADVARQLRDIARKISILELPGLPQKGDVSNWLDSGRTVRDLRRLAYSAPAWDGSAAAPPNGEAVPNADAVPPEYSDDSLALRFSTAHAEDARFVALWGKWLLWKTAAWKVDDTLRAFDISRTICRAASAEIDDPKRVKLASSIASAKTVAAVVNLARVDRHHAATVEQWDADPLSFNTERTL